MKTDIDKQITRVFHEFLFFSISWLRGKQLGLVKELKFKRKNILPHTLSWITSKNFSKLQIGSNE